MQAVGLSRLRVTGRTVAGGKYQLPSCRVACGLETGVIASEGSPWYRDEPGRCCS